MLVIEQVKGSLKGRWVTINKVIRRLVYWGFKIIALLVLLLHLYQNNRVLWHQLGHVKLMVRVNLRCHIFILPLGPGHAVSSGGYRARHKFLLLVRHVSVSVIAQELVHQYLFFLLFEDVMCWDKREGLGWFPWVLFGLDSSRCGDYLLLRLG